jgi:hypothetical protein
MEVEFPPGTSWYEALLIKVVVNVVVFGGLFCVIGSVCFVIDWWKRAKRPEADDSERAP